MLVVILVRCFADVCYVGADVYVGDVVFGVRGYVVCVYVVVC